MPADPNEIRDLIALVRAVLLGLPRVPPWVHLLGIEPVPGARDIAAVYLDGYDAWRHIWVRIDPLEIKALVRLPQPGRNLRVYLTALLDQNGLLTEPDYADELVI